MHAPGEGTRPSVPWLGLKERVLSSSGSKDAKGEEEDALGFWSLRLGGFSLSGPVKDREGKQSREAAKPRRGRAARRRIPLFASC